MLMQELLKLLKIDTETRDQVSFQHIIEYENVFYKFCNCYFLLKKSTTFWKINDKIDSSLLDRKCFSEYCYISFSIIHS